MTPDLTRPFDIYYATEDGDQLDRRNHRIHATGPEDAVRQSFDGRTADSMHGYTMVVVDIDPQRAFVYTVPRAEAFPLKLLAG